MITGYKLCYETVRVNSRHKAKKIVQKLREQGRHTFFDTLNKNNYMVYYWTKRGVI